MVHHYVFDCTHPSSLLSLRALSGVSSANHHQDIKTRQHTEVFFVLHSTKTVSNERVLGCRRVSDGNLRARTASPRHHHHHGPASRKQCLVPTAVSRVRHRAETDAAVFQRKVNISRGVFDHNSSFDWSADCDDKQRVSLQGATRKR